MRFTTVLSRDDIVIVTLPDGRTIDIFPSGNVQVYTPDGKHGVEIALPTGEPAWHGGPNSDPIVKRQIG